MDARRWGAGDGLDRTPPFGAWRFRSWIKPIYTNFMLVKFKASEPSPRLSPLIPKSGATLPPPGQWVAGRKILPLPPGEDDLLAHGALIAAFAAPRHYLWRAFYAIYLGRDERGVHVLGPWDDARCINPGIAPPEATGLLRWGHGHAAHDATLYRQVLIAP